MIMSFLPFSQFKSQHGSSPTSSLEKKVSTESRSFSPKCLPLSFCKSFRGFQGEILKLLKFISKIFKLLHSSLTSCSLNETERVTSGGDDGCQQVTFTSIRHDCFCTETLLQLTLFLTAGRSHDQHDNLSMRLLEVTKAGCIIHAINVKHHIPEWFPDSRAPMILWQILHQMVLD